MAEAFHRRATLNHAALEEAVRSGLGGEPAAERVRSATDALSHLGFIWAVAARPEWEPGIPSLMDYVRHHAPSR